MKGVTMLSSGFEPSRAEMRGKLLQSENFDQALDILAEITADMGFTQTLYGYIPGIPRLPNGEWSPLKLNVRNFPTGWEEGWEPYVTIDPYYRACFTSTLPIEWQDVQKSEAITSAQKSACNFLNDFGLSRGMTVPVHLPFGRFAVMSAIVDSTCHDWLSVRERGREHLFRLMHIFTQIILEMHFEEQIAVYKPEELTPREQECLRWAAAGKTSSDIAVIIDRSVETVRLHIKNSIAKLNATNRTHAVAMAVQRGLI
jgi:DNA-binding CsgD family transcriptional regulator